MTYLVFTIPISLKRQYLKKTWKFFLSDLITMVLEWNHFTFRQIDNPRWPPGAVTKNSTNTKMTISQELLDEIDPTDVSYLKPF